MELKIYDKQGVVKMTASPDNSSQWSHEVGVENVVTVNFTTWEFLVLEVGCYILVEGHLFSIKSEYRPKHIHNSKYTYNLKFYGREHDTQDILFCRLNQSDDDLESVFAYDGTPMDFLKKVVANMNRNSDGVVWKAGEAITANRQTINFNGLYCWDALGEIARTFGTEWWMDGEYLNLSKCIRGETVRLGYGEGLKTGLTQNENTNAVKWFTRLIPVGSTKNIDRNKYGYSNLQLPGREKYIDINTQYGLKEYREEAAFSEIYPHRVGTVSFVREEIRTNEETGEYAVYFVRDMSIPFNPNDYMIGGEVIHLTFKTGVLAGKEFEVNWNNTSKEFEIINQYPDDKTQIPGGNLIPSTGDTYVLSNISMPDEYIKAAEQEFKEAVDVYLAEYAKDISIYSGNTDHIYIEQNNVPLQLGQRIRLVSEQYFSVGAIDSRITRVSRKLNNLGEATIDCSDAVTSSWKSGVDSSLNQLQFAVAQEVSHAIVEILKTGDSRTPSDYNVFSALRTVKDFLSKQKDDKTPYNLGVGKNLTVGEDVVVGKNTHSKDFKSGFAGGKGWSIRNEKWTNAANEEETRSVAEFDDLIVRNSMRVYEFIVSQLLGENDNRIFTGMMEVDHYDAETGRIYLKTDNGKLYNPFRVDDVIIVQQYGEPTTDNGFYVTKEYEFIVTDAKVGDMSKGEDRLDWITFNNFVTTIEDGDVSLITERDTLVRIDNLSNPDRKGIIQMMAAGKDTPYMDIIYGRKTDPDNSLKGRLGNLGGIYNPLFGWLKEFGAYLNNLYAVGEFVIAHTGENVSDSIEIAKGQFRTNFRQSTYDLSDENNFFTNAAMTNNCEHWILGEDVTNYFLVDELPQFFNFELYASSDTFAGLAEWKGRDMLRLNKSSIRQLNSLIRKPGTHKVHGDAVLNEDGTFADNYKEEPDTLYLTVRLFVAGTSHVELGFIGEDGSFIDNIFHFSKEIESNEDAYDIKLTGTWDGQGDFCITATGDVYVDLLSLTDKPLDNFKVETETKFEQDGKRLALLGQKVNQATGTVTELALVVDAQKEQISSLVTKTNAIDDTISSSGWINEADSVRIFSEQLDAQGVATKAEIKAQVEDAVSKIEITADQIDLTGAVTFEMLSGDVKDSLDSKVDSSTIISGGFIRTELIDTETLNVNRVVTTGDSFGVTITIADGEITMKTVSSSELLRLYSNGTSSYLHLRNDEGDEILFIPKSSSFTFSNGKSFYINDTNGIELRGGMGIAYFTLSRISDNGFNSTSDFCILPNGGTWTLPSANNNKGRMFWIYPKRSATLKDDNALIYKSDGEAGNTLTISGMCFLISDGSNWYQGSCR